ncbi:uncharacterized protein LOC107264246 isoform X1 [Cephus cinctus]|uniref:Uncharacterized protein LOC107264246 isoform X1 n=2 Tax=Cephus cinctus TaxID=211228 RepID=A0AAJ7RBE7_CEPCN|nr:uncharacterized protein LOC107264246 isoform X1 [Cephus cinctus]
MQSESQRQSGRTCPGSLPDIAVTMASGREIHGAFSLIVDDVDSHAMLSETADLDGVSTESSSQNSSSQTPLDSPGGPRERIKQIQVEAETRRGEFARLLEEHAQVVRKLKMMEAEEQMTSSSSNVIGPTHA